MCARGQCRVLSRRAVSGAGSWPITAFKGSSFLLFFSLSAVPEVPFRSSARSVLSIIEARWRNREFPRNVALSGARDTRDWHKPFLSQLAQKLQRLPRAVLGKSLADTLGKERA